MLDKCANASCYASFRYLHEGKLFCVEIVPQMTSSNKYGPDSASDSSRKIEWYWLCSQCSGQMTLKAENGGKIAVVHVPSLGRETMAESVPNSRTDRGQSVAGEDRGSRSFPASRFVCSRSNDALEGTRAAT